jgi:hypothetical protein
MTGGRDATDEIRALARKSAKKANEAAFQVEMELVRFKTGDRSIAFNIDVTAETVWATQQQIADLFEIGVPAVSKHIANIYAEGELDPAATLSKLETVRKEGTREVTRTIDHYNLDVILSVGYRVSSPKATAFRQWATQTLRSYLVDGYAINEARLRADRDATNKLAAKLREMRAEERSVYASVREFFKEASTDYDSGSQACKSFYALLQDKFHYAITGNTASQIILSRADHREPNMGIQTFAGNMPTIDEAKIGKSYLVSDELYTLHILCEQFLLYIQSKALRGKTMTMKELGRKLDDLLRVNDYPVFDGYKDYLKDRAIKHAQVEYARFSLRLRQDDVKRIR